MFDYKLEINTEMFLGIYDSEKSNKNRVDIIIEYISDQRPDYTEVHDFAVSLAHSRKWGYAEDFAQELYRVISSMEHVSQCCITVTKINPPGMENSRISVRYNA